MSLLIRAGRLHQVPVAYMIAVDAWLQDKYSVKTMLLGKTALGLGFVLISLFALSIVKISKTSCCSGTTSDTMNNSKPAS